MNTTNDEQMRAAKVRELMGLDRSDRKAAEQAYTMSAFDYVANPVGSEDWCRFWDGWKAALASQPVAAEPTMNNVDLARKILVSLGYAIDPSREPRADDRVDRVAAIIATAQTPAPVVQEDEVCPNCVTLWKCNGPHELPGMWDRSDLAGGQTDAAPPADGGVTDALARALESTLEVDGHLMSARRYEAVRDALEITLKARGA